MLFATKGGFMEEPRPQEDATVIHVKVFGAMAKGMRDSLHLAARKENPELKKRFQVEQEAENLARKEAGYSGFTPQRQPLDDGETRGVPNVNIEDYISSLYAKGYFLIAASHEEHLVGENKRDLSRLVFSRKEEDRPVEQAEPTQEKVQRYFAGKVFQYLHYHDHRRFHPGLKKEIGNVLVDLAGTIQRSESCRTYRKLQMVDQFPHVALQVVTAALKIVEPTEKPSLTHKMDLTPLKEKLDQPRQDGKLDIDKCPPLKEGQRRFVMR
jgi:hypothetical protein